MAFRTVNRLRRGSAGRKMPSFSAMSISATAFRVRAAVLFALLLGGFAALRADPAVRGNSGIEAIDTLTVHEWDSPEPGVSPFLALPLAAFTPGGGHYATKRYVRGGFLTAIQLYLLSEVLVNSDARADTHRDRASASRRAIEDLTDSISRGSRDSPNVPVWKDSLRRELAVYRKANDAIVEERGLRQSEIAWLLGLQLYGVMDVWGILQHAKGRPDDRKSIPATVAWAVLLPGSGQIRNDEWGKAGLLYMAFIGSAVSFNERQKCVNWYKQRLRVARSEGNTAEIPDLEEKVSFFRKKRNQYVWGPILFYLYSIGDAVVDALLHDFDSPDHLAFAPELDPLGESFGMKLALDF